MLRPGRLTLSAKPATTGSATLSKTIGIVLVAACAALTAFVVDARMRSTRSFTSSAASDGSRSFLAVREALDQREAPAFDVAELAHGLAKGRQRRLHVGAGVGAEDADDLGRGLRTRVRHEQCGGRRSTTGRDGRAPINLPVEASAGPAAGPADASVA